MPKATIWIRVGNEEAWEKIENKSDWVNEQLHGDTISVPVIPEIPAKNKTDKSPAVRNKPEPTANEFKFCKNNHPIPEGRNRCMGKGCKYG